MNMQKFLQSGKFELFIAMLIGINTVTLGLETVEGLPASVASVLSFLDSLMLSIFVAELLAKMLVFRRKFFVDSWSIFDLLVVSVSLLPSTGPFTIVRSLRVLRALRMLSVIPSLRRVVQGLLMAIPGLGAVAAILILIFYVASVMSTRLFAAAFPEWFGSIAASAYTLFQVMTLESWSMGIVRPVMEKFPYAWLFFLPFILITSFTMLNLFIAVIVNAMHSDTEETVEKNALIGQDERGMMLQEIRALSAQVASLQQQLEKRKG